MDAPSITTPHPGPKSREILERLRTSEVKAGLSHGMADDPVVFDHAQGSVIVDPDGNRFLDMVAGFGSLSLGHSHPELVAAVQAQVARGQQAMSMASTLRTDLVERLNDFIPGEYQVMLAASGSEAAEVALKLVRRATGRHGVVAFAGGFHGRTMGALTLMGKASQRTGLGALLAGAVHLPYPDPYRSPFGTDPKQVADTTLALLDQQLGDPASGWMEVGAVIIEPLQGNGGMIPAPDGFLTGLREVCDRHDILLIVDEVMSGFHRTGTRFAYEHDADVKPDLIVMGKSLSAGLPLSACVVKAEIAARNPAGTESSTYAGNLVACASALAALDVYASDDYSARSRRLGEHFMAELTRSLGDHANVGEIRGRGLMVGVELVTDRDTRSPLGVARAVSNMATQQGLLLYPGGHHGNVLGFLPPLTASEEELSTCAARVGDLLESAEFAALG